MPTGVIVVEVLHETNDPKATVSWTAVTGATSYTIVRKVKSSNGSYSVLASDITGTSYDDTDIQGNDTCHY